MINRREYTTDPFLACPIYYFCSIFFNYRPRLYHSYVYMYICIYIYIYIYYIYIYLYFYVYILIYMTIYSHMNMNICIIKMKVTLQGSANKSTRQMALIRKSVLDPRFRTRLWLVDIDPFLSWL